MQCDLFLCEDFEASRTLCVTERNILEIRGSDHVAIPHVLFVVAISNSAVQPIQSKYLTQFSKYIF